eukprot:788047-Amphidinium_carterae.1
MGSWHSGGTCDASTQADGHRPPKLPSTGASSGSHRPNSVARRRHPSRSQRASHVGGHALPAAHVSHSIPAVKTFRATPKSTTHNALGQLTCRFNMGGCGCCSKHIAWTGLLEAVLAIKLCTEKHPSNLGGGWGKGDGSLNDWDVGATDSEDGDQSEQLCAVCLTFVMPQLPMDHTFVSTSSDDPSMS